MDGTIEPVNGNGTAIIESVHVGRKSGNTGWDGGPWYVTGVEGIHVSFQASNLACSASSLMENSSACFVSVYDGHFLKSTLRSSYITTSMFSLSGLRRSSISYVGNWYQTWPELITYVALLGHLTDELLILEALVALRFWPE